MSQDNLERGIGGNPQPGVILNSKTEERYIIPSAGLLKEYPEMEKVFHRANDKKHLEAINIVYVTGKMLDKRISKISHSMKGSAVKATGDIGNLLQIVDDGLQSLNGHLDKYSEFYVKQVSKQVARKIEFSVE